MAAARWAAANHPLSKFMVQTRHPDIDLRDADLPSSSRPAHGAATRDAALISA
jgi:hypothetical protein